MEEKREQIIEQAEELMMRFGIRSMTMDDLARHMGVSKKTLYQYFRDKSEIVKAVLLHHLERDRLMISDILKSGKNAIEELIEIGKELSRHLGSIHPSVHFDLEKYYPESWKKFNEHKATFIYNCVSGNIEKGIAAGIYRSDINVDIITRIYISRIDATIDPQEFPADKYSFSEIYFEMLKYHIRGIASPLGMQLLEEKLKELNN